MKINTKIAFIILVFISLNCSGGERTALSGYIYWEDLTERQKNEVLTSKGVEKNALALYKGEFELQDDEETFQLLDTLTNIDGEKSSLYFYLFNKACRETDGAIAEVLGGYCQKIILKSPGYVITYLSRNESLLQKYSEYLGYEMYFKEDGTSTIEYSYEEFKMKLSEKITGKANLVETVYKLYKYIEETMKNMD